MSKKVKESNLKLESMQLNLDYERPIHISEDVYWIGFYDKQASLHCNPYMIVDNDEVVIIDGGSRPDFPSVLMKILQTGVKTSSIKALIYSHYDPDLVGSVSNFEEIINNKDLKIISDAANNMFIRHYSVQSNLYSISSLRNRYLFSSGRELLFFNTPYSHSQGSFITFDTKTNILFTSDLFGSYDTKWELFTEIQEECKECILTNDCIINKSTCPVRGIMNFHRKIMTSNQALKYAMEIVKKIPVKMVAPQHGSIISREKDIKFLINLLSSLDNVGIDGVIRDNT